MNSRITAPVLLIGFNRPDTTEQVFQKIREVQPLKLYVALDGPRENKEGEAELVEKVKKIVQKVDWNCNVKYLFRDKNLGCKLGVSGAISWALENEDRIIIIEDDIIAVSSFFYFADELLEKYKDDCRIAMISANNYTPLNDTSDYLFTRYGHIWGWATWKRVWDKFDLELPYLKEDINNSYLKTIGLAQNELRYFEKYANNIFNSIENQTINTWDYQFGYYRLRNNLLSIAPRVNLASNIGIVSSRTANMSKVNRNYFPANDAFVLLKHPVKVKCDAVYEKHHFKKHIRKPLITKAFYKLLKLFNG